MGLDWRPLWISLKVAGAATAISLTAGTLLGAWLAHGNFPGRRWLSAFVLLPLALPPTVLGWYLLVLLGRRSPVGRFYEWLFEEPIVFTLKAAVVAACASTVPIVARQLAAAFALADRDLLEAARLDGASGVRLLWRVQLPLIRPALMAAAAIAFARAMGDFGATLMVAGNIPGRTQTAAIAIYDLVNSGRETEAAVLVVFLSAVALGVLVFASEASGSPSRRKTL